MVTILVDIILLLHLLLFYYLFIYLFKKNLNVFIYFIIFYFVINFSLSLLHFKEKKFYPKEIYLYYTTFCLYGIEHSTARLATLIKYIYRYIYI